MPDPSFPWDEPGESPVRDGSDDPDTSTFLTVEVGGSVFALDVASVHEVLDPRPVAPLPGSDMCILGTFDLRGKSVLAVDGGTVFNLPRAQIASEERFVVVAHDDGEAQGLIGVSVDRVRAVEDLEISGFETTHGNRGATQSSAVQGILRRTDEAILKVDLIKSLEELGVLSL